MSKKNNDNNGIVSSKHVDVELVRMLVDAGFHVMFNGGEGDLTCTITTAASTDQANGITKQPTVLIPLPKTLSIRYYPNQNKTTNVFAPRNPPRVKINNINQKFDTLEEFREYLYESYDEALENIREKRQLKLDARADKHRDYLDARSDVEKRMHERTEKKLENINKKSK